MSYITALGCVLAIVAIIVIGALIITFLAKIIINVFDSERKLDSSVDNDEDDIRRIRDNVYESEKINTRELKNAYLDNEQVSKVEKNTSKATKEVESDEDYSYAKDIDTTIAKREKAALEKEIRESGKEADNNIDDDFFSNYKTSEAVKEPKIVKPIANTQPIEEDEDDLDIMSMIDEISDDVIDNKKNAVKEKSEADTNKNKSILDKYSIDNVLNHEDEIEDADETDNTEEDESNNANEEVLSEMKGIKNDIMAMLEELRKNTKQPETTKDEPVVEEKVVASATEEDESDLQAKIDEEVSKRVDAKLAEHLHIIEDLKRLLEEKQTEVIESNESKKELESKYAEINKKMVEQFANQNREIETTMTTSVEQINTLKNKLDTITKQLEEERSLNWKVAETNPTVYEKPSDNAKKKVEVIEQDEDDEDEDDDKDKGRVVDIEILKQVANSELEEIVEEKISESTQTIKELTERVEKLTGERVTTYATPVENVVHFQFSSEDQYLNRIAILEERLKDARKDLKINDKEYKPLEKVKRTLDKDKAKLRRKEAIAAKKKVALYGVNNYVDIDKEKAEKLAHELELLDGLRLSVSHCEEVMAANTERYPILEHTHIILTKNVNDLEADLNMLNKELQALKDNGGKK